jgi:hypothetical protein
MDTRMLPVRLNEEELLTKASLLSTKVHELAIEEDDQKDAKAAMKKRLDDLNREITDVARIVREKVEPRPVEVHESKNYARRIVEIVRVDTGEVVDSRPMTEQERNVDLFPEVREATKADA